MTLKEKLRRDLRLRKSPIRERRLSLDVLNLYLRVEARVGWPSADFPSSSDFFLFSDLIQRSNGNLLNIQSVINWRTNDPIFNGFTGERQHILYHHCASLIIYSSVAILLLMDPTDLEMQEFTNSSRKITTEVFDSALPSDIDFDKTPKKNHSSNQSPIKPLGNITQSIRSYRIKGKAVLTVEPKYRIKELIVGHLPTFEVKSFDEQKSQGVLKIWQSVVGYCKRELYINEGNIYSLQKQNGGYLVQSVSPLGELFQIFTDPEEFSIRFVFKGGHNSQDIFIRNYEVERFYEFTEKLSEQINAVGLTLCQ